MGTTCLQSQIGGDHHLRRKRTAQVEATVALSVVVRWGPVRTAVNGTVVARPVGDDVRRAGGEGISSIAGGVRPGDRLPRWQELKGSRQPKARTSILMCMIVACECL
jgi:hypothetical protein